MPVVRKEEEIQKIVSISGVSRSTVFRYLAGKQIRESSRKAIIEAQNTIREQAVEGDHQGSKEIVVSIDPTIFDIFHGNSEVLAGIMDEAGVHNTRISIERDYHNELSAAGVILVGKHDPEESDEIRMLKEAGIPFVVVNRMIEDEKVSYVSANVFSCAYDMCQHLFSQGCSRIAFWGELETRVSKDKFNGYKEALTENGCYDESLVFSDKVPLERMFDEFLSMKNPPDAFLSMDDETATRALRIAYEKGLHVPDSFFISGMNDLGSSQNIIPSLTSAHIDFRKLGKLALGTLLRLIQDPEVLAIKTTVRHRIIVRDSTRRARA